MHNPVRWRKLLKFIAPLLATLLSGCSVPPHMLAKDPAARIQAPSEGQAKVIILRTSSWRGGHIVVVDETGHLHGTLVEGSSLETSLPAGKHVLFSWNPRQEEQNTSKKISDIASLSIEIDAGKVYYIAHSFCAFADRESEVWAYSRKSLGFVRAACAYQEELLALGPKRQHWDKFTTWLQETKPYVRDPAEAQAWEAANRLSIRDHIEWGMARLGRMSQGQLQQRALEPTDGLGL